MIRYECTPASVEIKRRNEKRLTFDQLSLFVPNDEQLVLDLDTRRQFYQFIDGVKWMQRHTDLIQHVLVKPSGGGNLHALITLTKPMSVSDRIALQATLGSDPLKEFLSIHRCHTGQENPITLFVTNLEWQHFADFGRAANKWALSRLGLVLGLVCGVLISYLIGWT